MDLAAILSDGLRAALGIEAAVFALAAIGLNVQFGYTGLLNFGQSGFMLVGAYGVAVVVAVYGGPLWLGIAVGLGLAVLLALLLGIPTLRLRTDYLAIATLAVAEILRIALRSNTMRPITNGVFGLQQFAGEFYALNPIPPGGYGLAPLEFSERQLWVSGVGWLLVGLCTLLVFLLMRSPWGRVLRSIREDEDAARSLGKNVFGFKLQSLILGGVIGALAGIMLALNQQAVNPDTYAPALTFFAYTILILGGPGRALGPIAGAIVFWFIVAGLDTALRQATGSGLIPASILRPEQVGVIRLALVGLGLILLMVFRPQGIFGSRKELLIRAR